MTSYAIPISVSFARTSSFVSGIFLFLLVFILYRIIIRGFFCFSLDIGRYLVKNIIKDYFRI